MKKINIKRIITALIMSVMCVMVSVMPSIRAAYALDIGIIGGYTDVLEDLKKDETFNGDDYPVKENDYSLDVITIAESAEKELFVYVYQPSGADVGIEASYITISNAYHNAENSKVYKLTLINRNGVFCKYLVNGFTLSNEETRYYEVYDILRPFNAEYGDQAVAGNEVTNVTYKVAKQFTIVDKDGEYLVGVTGTDTIEITEKFVGYVRYENNSAPSWAGSGSLDNHFVAFDTDKPIDRLYEATVYYSQQSFTSNFTGLTTKVTYGDIEDDKYAYLVYTKNHSYTGENVLFWSGYTYDWQEISTIDEFIANENRSTIYEQGIFNTEVSTELTDDGLSKLNGKKWVLFFTQTDYFFSSSTTGTGLTSSKEEKTIVGNVKILRLKFETDGITYNLGVVDNMQSGDGNPINTTTYSMTLNDTFKILLGILLLIVLIVALSPILPVVINVILTVLKAIVTGIIWVITLPFKLLKAIFKKRE